MVAFRTTRAA
jgi:hypothetical protein